MKIGDEVIIKDTLGAFTNSDPTRWGFKFETYVVDGEHGVAIAPHELESWWIVQVGDRYVPILPGHVHHDTAAINAD